MLRAELGDQSTQYDMNWMMGWDYAHSPFCIYKEKCECEHHLWMICHYAKNFSSGRVRSKMGRVLRPPAAKAKA